MTSAVSAWDRAPALDVISIYHYIPIYGCKCCDSRSGSYGSDDEARNVSAARQTRASGSSGWRPRARYWCASKHDVDASAHPGECGLDLRRAPQSLDRISGRLDQIPGID